MKKALFLFFSVLTFLFVSCENFMNGSDVQEELTKMIDVANAKDYTIIVSQDEAMGSFLSYGDKNCKIGYSIDLQFTVDSENYIYQGLKVVSKDNQAQSREDCVELTEVSTAAEKKNGIHKVQVKLIKESNDIMIRPDCILIPKIKSFSPVNLPTNYDQDTPIEITFNKPMKPESFGNFNCISIYSNEIADLKDYFDFENASFYVNNTKLKIDPKQDRHIIPPDSGKSMPITVEVNFSNEKDAEGQLIKDNKIYTYKINEKFGNQKISTILVREDDDSKSGKFDKTGEIKCTVGYSFDLQFTLKKAAYVFNGLEAVSKTTSENINSEIVEFETIKRDDDLGIYTIQVKIKEESNDILIKPKCILIPKITKITPEYTSPGCYQDETITIEFNKSVSPESFGNFECISISSGDEELTSTYFDTPLFFDDNTRLKITPKAKLLPPDSGKKKDINIRIDFTNLKDIDGLSLESYPTYSYRINDNFNNQEISEIIVEADTNNSTGTFDKNGQIKCTVGYDVKLQFKLNKSLYVFTGLKVDRRNTSQAYNPEDITISYDGDESTGIYDITVHMNNKTENIKLSPNCKLIPRVSQITPSYTSTGIEQDSPIEITFNKAVDRASFGDFSCIDIYSDGDDLKSEYFNAPVFNEENTVLKITSKKLILQPDSGKKKDINVKIDFTDLRDCDGLPIEYSPTYSYRINDTYSNQKKSKILIQNPTNTAEGSFDKTGEVECSVGYDINLQFKLNKADYIFDGLNIESRNTTQAFDENAVTITSSGDNDSGIYSILIHVNQETENIKLSPNCKLIPRVSQITPSYTSTGCEQDESIEIKFNKAVDTSTFGNFSCIDIFAEGEDLKDEYYNTPIFTENNTVVKFTKKKLILQPDSGKKKDINVKIDFTNLKDIDGLSIEPYPAYFFRINDSFEGQEKARVLIREITDSSNVSTGTFNKTGQSDCTVGYPIELQFTVKKSDYIFKRLVAVNSNDHTSLLSNSIVEFERIDSKCDDTAGVYTYNALIKQRHDNIEIHAECSPIPKIIEVTPAYESTGCEQDTTISVTFNKPIEISEFFSPTITDASGNNLAGYFDTPYLSDDSETLYIPPMKIKEKRLLDINGSTEIKDILVKLDLSNIKDEDGNSGSGIYQHKYRVNKTLDNVKPVLNSVDLYSTPDRTSVYFTHLTDKAFNDWNNSGNNNGDFGKNHITDSVYIEIEATDNSSGIAGILVKEKLYKYSDGSSTPANEPVVPYYIEVEKSQEANKYFCNYTMGNTYDGIIELEIFAQDYADNLSQTSKKYYILKDTLIDTSLLRFNEETIALEPGQWLNAILEQEIDGDNQNVKITLPENTKDIFYDNLTSDFDLHVYWGYSKDSITNSVTRNGNEFSFTRDVKRLVYIKIECKDSVGNKKETIKSMDPRAIIERFIYTLPDPNNNIYFSTNIEVKDVASMLLQNEKDVESISGVKLIFDIEGDENKKMAVYDTNLMLNGDIISDWAYRFRDATQSQIPYGSSVKMYAVSLCGDFLSPISQDYVQFTITNWPENEAPQDIVYADNCSPRLSSQTNNSTGNGTGEILYELGPYIKDTFKVKAEPIKNSGSYKITLDDYMTPAGKNNSDVRYEFTLYNKYGKLGTIDTHQFMIWAPEECIIFVTAISPDGKIYKPYQDFNEQQLIMESFEQYTIDDPYYGNLNLGELGQFNFYLNESANTENILELTKDVRAPHFKLNDSNFYETCSAAGYNIYLPIGDIIETTNPGQPEQDLYKNENGKYEFSYYLLPNSSNKLQRGMTYSLEELNTYYSKYERKYEFTMLRTEATIPFGNKEGLFNLVAVAKDTSGNYSIITTPVVSRTLGPITYTRDPYDGTVSATLNSNEHLQIYYFNTGWNGWSQTNENLTFYNPEGNPVNTHENWYKITGYRDFADGSDSARDIGFFYTEYFYGLPAVCNSKNILNGYNGYQVFCDRPVFVHTMFSPDKLTDSTESENALQIWESKGAETGRVVNNSNFTYAKDKYNDIPSGWYYTTIFHFADGDVIMTDIQQK